MIRRSISDTARREVLRLRRRVAALERELALQRLERGDALLDGSPVAILVDVEGRIVGANPAAAQVFGATDVDALIGRPTVDLLVEAGAARAALVRDLGGALEQGTPLALRRLSGVGPDGQERTLQLSGVPCSYERRSAVQLFVGDVTPVRDTEHALRDTEERLRRERDLVARIAETSPVAIITLDAEGQLTFANGRAEQVLGLRRDEITGRRYDALEWTITSPDGGPFSDQQLPFAVVARERRAVNGVRHAIVWPDGRRVLLSINAAPLVATDGTFEGVVATLDDVTEDLERQRQLAASEARFRSVLQASPMGVHLYELQGDRLVFVGSNPAADRILGVDCARFVGKTIEEAFPPLAATEVPARYRAAAARGEPWHTEQIDYEHGRVAGAYEVYSFQTSPGRMAALFLDITERLRAAAELRESQQKLKGVFESTLDAIAVADLAGVLLDCNPAALRLFGAARPEQVLGRPVYDFVAADQRPELAKVIRQALDRGAAERFELTVVAIDGKLAPVESGASLIRDADGTPRYLLAVFRDISERRRAEQERGRLEAQLFQAQKMEAIGRLAGGIAHDFNNLLCGINGYAEMLQAVMHEDDPQWADVGQIREAGERAAQLTNQLLAFSRQQVLAPRVVDLAGVVGPAERILRRIIGEDIVLDVVVGRGAGRARIVADPMQIDQILFNLVVNGRDAMPRGGRLAIEVFVEKDDLSRCSCCGGQARGPFAVLAVTDTGTGMDTETRLHAFEPFFTTKEKGKGTGLGLAMVYGAVTQHGGHIELVSQPGQGTRVVLRFPLVDAPPATEEIETVMAAELPRGGGETVLLVEDEPVVRRLAKRVLQRQGYRVLEASSGGEAIVIAEQHGQVSLLLTDVVMPNLDGRALRDRLRTIYPTLRTLFMSGYTSEVIEHHGVRDDGTPLLLKPFTLESLARKVREVLDS